MKKTFFVIGAVILALGVFTAFRVVNQRQDEKTRLSLSARIETDLTQNQSFASQMNDEGAVTVTVTPRLRADGGWEFGIVLDTHSEELTSDLVTATVLQDDKGREYAPVSWEGDPPGGHHRSGVLRFGTIDPSPISLALIIRDIGGIPERAFLWTTAP